MSEPDVPSARKADIATPAAPSVPSAVPWFGLAAVLLGTCISTLTTRLSVFGLADIRAAVDAGFDEGSWITTAQSVGQMLVCPVAIWFGTAFGPRKVLLEAAVAFAVISSLTPFSPNLPTLLGLQFAAGLASGFFVPLTLGFLLVSMPPRFWAYAVAVYALNLEVSLNISASLEAWYLDNLTWRWIFWQNVPLAAGMALCLYFGVGSAPANPNRPRADLFGFASGGIGLALVYAALDQGNRLDWFGSGLVWGLMLSGAILLAGFFVHEIRTLHPGIDFEVVFRAPLPRLLLLIGFLRLAILSTAFVIPQFLLVARGFRTLEVGQSLIWIAAPQLLICLLAGYLLRRADPRLVASLGFLCISLACLMVAHGLTPLWGSDQFLPSQLLQAVGQSFALSGVVFFAVLHLRPQDALTFGSALQTARLLGGEVGAAFIATFVRVRGQIASNLLGQHVQLGDGQTVARIQSYAAITGPASDPAAASTHGAAVLNSAVHAAAITQGIIDSFVVLGAFAALTLIIIVTRRAAPPGPASHVPFLAPRVEPLP